MINYPLPPPFINETGSIQNLEVPPEALGFVSVIDCLAGSRRSSHYHKTDSHFLYVLAGSMRYRQRMIGEEPEPWHIVEAGQMVYTPANVEHWTEFPERTVLISISKKPRDHKSHEKDLVRVPWME